MKKVLKNQKKNILITAGNSNIGSDLIKYFIKKKYDILETYRLRRNKINSSKINHLKFDFKKSFKIKKDFDLLIHCAALTPYKYNSFNESMNLNLVGFNKILNSKSNFKNIVLLSTMSVYGIVDKKIVHENTKKNKINAYGLSKLKMEKILINHSKKKKINFLILRLPGVIGNFNSDVNFINKIINNFINNKVVKYKNPNSYFNNVVHTDTIAQIIEKFVTQKNKKIKNKIFNLSSTKPMKLHKLINKIRLKTNSKSIIKILPPDNTFKISTKKCEINDIKLISTNSTITKNLNYILDIK